MHGTWEPVPGEEEPSQAPYFHADPSLAPQGYIEHNEEDEAPHFQQGEQEGQ